MRNGRCNCAGTEGLALNITSELDAQMYLCGAQPRRSRISARQCFSATAATNFIDRNYEAPELKENDISINDWPDDTSDITAPS